MPWFKFRSSPKTSEHLPSDKEFGVATHGLVRLAHPRNQNGLHRWYYCERSASWVSSDQDYTRWTLAEWQKKFGNQDAEGRHWEFFGELIPLYDEDELP